MNLFKSKSQKRHDSLVKAGFKPEFLEASYERFKNAVRDPSKTEAEVLEIAVKDYIKGRGITDPADKKELLAAIKTNPILQTFETQVTKLRQELRDKGKI